MNSLTISQIARLTDVPVATIRFYERTGLIAEPPRRASGYRQYPPEAVNVLRFVRHAKELGFTLHEIRELCELTQQGDAGASKVKAIVEAKLAVVDDKLAELKQVRRKLNSLIALCPGNGPLEACPIVAALSRQ